jgi:hypothetical protein
MTKWGDTERSTCYASIGLGLALVQALIMMKNLLHGLKECGQGQKISLLHLKATRA